jgi:hypothetical protein
MVFFSYVCQRRVGYPIRVYMDLEAGRKRSGVEDLFISYHAKDDVQSTYAGALFHNGRNYHVSSLKNNVSTELSYMLAPCAFNNISITYLKKKKKNKTKRFPICSFIKFDILY